MGNPQRSVFQSSLLIIFALLFLCLQLFPAGRDFIAGLERTTLQALSETDKLSAGLRRPIQWFQSKQELNLKLQAEELKVRQLEAEVAAFNQANQENRELMGSRSELSSGKAISAHLLRGETQYFLDVGTRDGVNPGAIVKAQGSFLGVVVNASESLSSLSTLADADLRLGAKVEGSGAAGVLAQNQGRLLLTTVVRTEGVTVGDPVVTLGDRQVRIPGILIGKIAGILTRPADSVSKFSVKPEAEVGALTAVTVIKE